VKVPLTTVDDLVSELKLRRVDFIKMDIAGAEKRALLGARSTLVTYTPRLVIAAEHLPDDGEAIPLAVCRYGKLSNARRFVFSLTKPILA